MRKSGDGDGSPPVDFRRCSVASTAMGCTSFAMMCHARPDVVLAEIRVSFNVSVLKRVLHGPRGDRVIKTTSNTKFELLGINWLDLEPLISHVRIPCADYLAIPIDS